MTVHCVPLLSLKYRVHLNRNITKTPAGCGKLKEGTLGHVGLQLHPTIFGIARDLGSGWLKKS
jgi:hypothetical protein